MKQVTVSGTIILRENNGIKEIFATQRGYGNFKGGWELPVGKLEPGETPEQCIVREIRVVFFILKSLLQSFIIYINLTFF